MPTQQQSTRHTLHELSYDEIRRRLHLDQTQLPPVIKFIELECINRGIPQSGPIITATVPWQDAQKHVLEAVLEDVVKKFMPIAFPPAGILPENAKNALLAIVHNIRRTQRKRNTRREYLIIFSLASFCELLTFSSKKGQEESGEGAEIGT